MQKIFVLSVIRNNENSNNNNSNNNSDENGSKDNWINNRLTIKFYLYSSLNDLLHNLDSNIIKNYKFDIYTSYLLNNNHDILKINKNIINKNFIKYYPCSIQYDIKNESELNSNSFKYIIPNDDIINKKFPNHHFLGINNNGYRLFLMNSNEIYPSIPSKIIYYCSGCNLFYISPCHDHPEDCDDINNFIYL